MDIVGGYATSYLVLAVCTFTDDGCFFRLGSAPSQLLGGESENELRFGFCCSVTGKILHLVCACS